MAVSTLFVTTAITETLKGTILDVTVVRGAKQQLHPKSYRLAKTTQYIIPVHEQSRTPPCVLYIYIYIYVNVFTHNMTETTT